MEKPGIILEAVTSLALVACGAGAIAAKEIVRPELKSVNATLLDEAYIKYRENITGTDDELHDPSGNSSAKRHKDGIFKQKGGNFRGQRLR